MPYSNASANRRRTAGDSGSKLKHVQYELVSTVVRPSTWIVVVPLAVVDRNPHLGTIPEVQIISTSVVVVTSEILRIIDEWIVVKAFPTLVALGTPRSPERLLSGCFLCRKKPQRHGANCSEQKLTDH